MHATNEGYHISELELPIADSVYVKDDVTFEVYRAKDMYHKEWRHPSFHTIVSLARTSYRRYGPRDLFDKYDDKAVIYLVRARYPRGHVLGTDAELVNEWLSVRMVPGDGDFEGVGELELYTFNKVPIVDIFCKKNKFSKNNFWHHVISDSRMCGIHPYTVGNDKVVASLPTERHKYTPECMALMQAQFMVDFPPQTTSFTYVSAIVRPEIRDKVITLRKGAHHITPNFISAHTTLGLTNDAKVVVERNAYTYQFPRYWLHMEELKTLIRRLLLEKKLTEKTLQHYLGEHDIDSLDGELALAKILVAEGTLVDAVLSGEGLRALVDKEVSDVPELQIIPIDSWRSGFLHILVNAGVDVFKVHPELKRFMV
ncbi:MAG: hypothetical protein WCQ60_00530 [bacterium]